MVMGTSSKVATTFGGKNPHLISGTSQGMIATLRKETTQRISFHALNGVWAIKIKLSNYKVWMNYSLSEYP